MTLLKKFARMPVTRALLAILVVALAVGCGDDDNNSTGPNGGTPDATAPTVLSTNPINGTTGVALINVTFSEPMSSSSINSTSFTLTGPGGASVAGVVAYDAAHNRASFVPSSTLALGTAYTATVMTQVEDESGNALTSNYIWHFTTAAAVTVQVPLPLESTAGYVVLSGSTITSTGATSITGDLGLSPGTSLTGFPPGIIVGTSHVGDASSVQAKLDLTTAYNGAAGRTVGPVSVAGNIGGMTLPPGLYKSTAGLEISSGDLTLDAQGNSDAIWIFQIASTLTTSAGRQVILSGGAQASNVYWQVGTSATLGTTSEFKGTIMANQSITMNTDASLEGRAFARIGAVTMNGNTITMPTP